MVFGLTVFFSASISQLRDWICLLDSLASCLACLRASVLRFADSVKSANCRKKRWSTQAWRCVFVSMCDYQHVWLCVCLPWTCTSPQIPACSLRQWSHIEPWCPSEQQLDQAWSCCPPPSSADESGHSPVHLGFPDDNKNEHKAAKRCQKCKTIKAKAWKTITNIPGIMLKAFIWVLVANFLYTKSLVDVIT